MRTIKKVLKLVRTLNRQQLRQIAAGMNFSQVWKYQMRTIFHWTINHLLASLCHRLQHLICFDSLNLSLPGYTYSIAATWYASDSSRTSLEGDNEWTGEKLNSQHALMSPENRAESTAHHKSYPGRAVRGLLSYLHPRGLQMQGAVRAGCHTAKPPLLLTLALLPELVLAFTFTASGW